MRASLVSIYSVTLLGCLFGAGTAALASEKDASMHSKPGRKARPKAFLPGKVKEAPPIEDVHTAAGQERIPRGGGKVEHVASAPADRKVHRSKSTDKTKSTKEESVRTSTKKIFVRKKTPKKVKRVSKNKKVKGKKAKAEEKKAKEAAAKQNAHKTRSMTKCLDRYGKLVCGFWYMTTGLYDHEVLPVSPPPVSMSPTVGISLATFGPSELLMEQLDNFMLYTMHETMIAVHVSSSETVYGSAQAQACASSMYPGRVVVSPINFKSGWGSPFILLSHLLNYVTFRSYGINPQYFVFVPRNMRFFKPGLECFVSHVKMSIRGGGTPSPMGREKWSSSCRKEKPKEFQKLFKTTNFSRIMIMTSYHEGMMSPSSIMESFVEWVSNEVAGGMQTFQKITFAFEEWYFQSWTVNHYRELTTAKEPPGSYVGGNKTYAYPRNLVFGGDAKQPVSPNNAVVMDRHQKQGQICSEYEKLFRTFNGSVREDVSVVALQWKGSCQRNFAMDRIAGFYDSNVGFVGVKRVGDHVGDFLMPVLNAAPGVPADASVKTHCYGPLWSGFKLPRGEIKGRQQKKLDEWKQFILSRDPDDCIHESEFYTRLHEGSNSKPIPDTCKRILATTLTPRTGRNIIRNTTKCHNSPYYFEYPPQCSGGWNGILKNYRKLCDALRYQVEHGLDTTKILGQLQAAGVQAAQQKVAALAAGRP
jgi:hypothetical protein